MKSFRIRTFASLFLILALGPLTGRTAHALVLGPAGTFLIKVVGETAAGLVVAQSYDALKKSLMGTTNTNPVYGDFTVGLQSYDEYRLLRVGNVKIRQSRSVRPNPITGDLSYLNSTISYLTNTGEIMYRSDLTEPFGFDVRDLYEGCGSTWAATQNTRQITTKLLVRHSYVHWPASPSQGFRFNLFLAHTGAGAEGMCFNAPVPIADGVVSLPGFVPAGGLAVVGLPAQMYPNIVTAMSLGSLTMIGNSM